MEINLHFFMENSSVLFTFFNSETENLFIIMIWWGKFPRPRSSVTVYFEFKEY